ncbi:MAG: TraR/DksA family transcriptional regulator [Candidatus Saccharimonadales bacterium]
MNAMPFGPGKIRELQTRLSSRRDVLKEEVTDALQDIGGGSGVDLAGQVNDLKDASLAGMLTDMRLADMHRDIQELLDVDAALMRIQTGRYGICTDCGEEIPLQRLEVYPTAKRCRPCQEVHEKRRDVTGGVMS